MASTTTRSVTTEELLALPDDGVERWLIHGELREEPMTKRNRHHTRAATRVARFLDEWLDRQPRPRGAILTGEAGVILRRDPDTTVGVDVAYVGAEAWIAENPETTLVEGPPVLAVEILSPHDKHQDIEEKIAAYLSAGVAIVWIVNTDSRTITVHRPDAKPQLFNDEQEITAEPHLPGFRAAVASLLPEITP